MNRSALEIFTGSSERATALAFEHLCLAGWMLVPPDDLQQFTVETPKQFCERLNISWMHMRRRLEEPGCPDFESERGKSNRLIKLRSNPQLERWMQKQDTRFKNGHPYQRHV